MTYPKTTNVLNIEPPVACELNAGIAKQRIKKAVRACASIKAKANKLASKVSKCRRPAFPHRLTK